MERRGEGGEAYRIFSEGWRKHEHGVCQDERYLHVHLNHSVWSEDAQNKEDNDADGDADNEDGGGRLGDHGSYHLLFLRQRGDRPGCRGGGHWT